MEHVADRPGDDIGIAFQDEGAAVRALVQPTTPAISRLRKAFAHRRRLTPSFRRAHVPRQLVAGAQRACGISRRTCSQICRTRAWCGSGRIGAATGPSPPHPQPWRGSPRAAGFFARPASLRRSSSSWSRFRSPQCTRGCLRVIPYTNLTGWTAEPNVLDGYWLKCINGLSNGRGAGLSRRWLGQHVVRPVGQKARLGHHRLQHRRNINQTVARTTCGGDRLQHWRAGRRRDGLVAASPTSARDGLLLGGVYAIVAVA